MFKSEQNLTEGSISKTLILFALPFVFANFLQALYGACDLIIIGHFTGGSSSISSVATGAQVMHIVISFIIGLTTGTTVLVGHAYGAGKKEEIEKIIGTVFIFFLSNRKISHHLSQPVSYGCTHCRRPAAARNRCLR